MIYYTGNREMINNFWTYSMPSDRVMTVIYINVLGSHFSRIFVNLVRMVGTVKLITEILEHIRMILGILLSKASHKL